MVTVRVWKDDWPTVTLPKSTRVGLMEISLAGTPVPFTVTLVAPPEALCVISSVSEKVVDVVTGGGEKLTTTDFDLPGGRTNEPPPLTTVKGLERLVESTFPVKSSVELDRLVIVRVWRADFPPMTSSKLRGLGLTEILMTGFIPVPDRPTLKEVPLEQPEQLMLRLSEETLAEDGLKAITTAFDCPGPRLNPPPPLRIENGAARLLASTVPVMVAVSVFRSAGLLKRVRVWEATAVVVTLPKLIEAGVRNSSFPAKANPGNNVSNPI